MPLKVLSEPAKKEAQEQVDSDLKWLLSENGVSVEAQLVLFHFGLKKLRLFAGLADDKTDLRNMLKDQFGVDPDTSIQERLVVATVVVAWQAAQNYIVEDDKKKAEARASKIPKALTPVEHQAMRKAFEAQWGSLQKWEVPSKSYLGLKQEDIEDDEPKAEKLTEVFSKDDSEDLHLTADVDIASGGLIKIKKGAQHGVMPQDPEELRVKLRIMGNAWLFLKTKHTNRAWLKDLDKDVWVSYADHLLGKKVYGLRDSKGEPPSWHCLLYTSPSPRDRG